jgi:hypothetical protein
MIDVIGGGKSALATANDQIGAAIAGLPNDQVKSALQGMASRANGDLGALKKELADLRRRCGSSCDFETSRPLIYVDYIERPEEPRFAHVDLGLTNDSAGVAVGWVSGFTKIKRGSEHWEVLPVIEMDLVLEVKPPRNGEIEFENIRRLFYRLREAGMNLKWITFDTYQSRDSVQLLRQKGFRSDLVSVDTDFVPYEVTKTAFYDGRLRLQEHEKALQELVRLERDPRTGKVDHPPAGSKDCSDAIVGVAYGLTYRREIWLRHQIPLTEIPASLMRMPQEKKQDDRRPRTVDNATPDMEFRRSA